MSIPVLHGHDQTSGNSLMSFYLRVMSDVREFPYVITASLLAPPLSSAVCSARSGSGGRCSVYECMHSHTLYTVYGN